MDSLITVFLPLALAIIMFSLGLGLTLGDFKRILLASGHLAGCGIADRAADAIVDGARFRGVAEPEQAAATGAARDLRGRGQHRGVERAVAPEGPPKVLPDAKVRNRCRCPQQRLSTMSVGSRVVMAWSNCRGWKGASQTRLALRIPADGLTARACGGSRRPHRPVCDCVAVECGAYLRRHLRRCVVAGAARVGGRAASGNIAALRSAPRGHR